MPNFSLSQLQAWAQQAAQTYGVPYPILSAVIQQESSWNPNVGLGGAGEVGMTQISPGVYQSLGIDPSQLQDNPQLAFNTTAGILANNYAKNGNSWWQAVKSYNGSGPAATNYANEVIANANAAAGLGSSTSSTDTTGATEVSPLTGNDGSTLANPWQQMYPQLFGPGSQGTPTGSGEAYTPPTGNPITDFLTSTRDQLVNWFHSLFTNFTASLPIQLPRIGIAFAAVLIILFSLAYMFSPDGSKITVNPTLAKMPPLSVAEA